MVADPPRPADVLAAVLRLTTGLVTYDPTEPGARQAAERSVRTVRVLGTPQAEEAVRVALSEAWEAGLAEGAGYEFEKASHSEGFRDEPPVEPANPYARKEGA